MRVVSADKGSWFWAWTRERALWVLGAFALVLVLEFPFTFFFDTTLTPFGFMFVYFWALPLAAILYFVAFKVRVRWTSTLIVGLLGIIGVPVDYYFDWVVQQNLWGPIYALLYVPLFLLQGFSADISLVKLRPWERPVPAVLVSSLIFTAVTLATYAVATYGFYPVVEGSNWLSYGAFLLPYSLATGAVGGYLGFSLARDTGKEVKAGNA